MGSGCAPLTSLALPCGHPPTHHQPRTLGLPRLLPCRRPRRRPRPFLCRHPRGRDLGGLHHGRRRCGHAHYVALLFRLCENRRYRLHACLLLRPGLDTVPGRRCCGRDGDARRRHHKSYLVGSAVRLFREEPSVPRFRRAVSSLPRRRPPPEATGGPQAAGHRSYPVRLRVRSLLRAVPPSPNIRSPADRSYKPSPASCLPLSSSRPYASAM